MDVQNFLFQNKKINIELDFRESGLKNILNYIFVKFVPAYFICRVLQLLIINIINLIGEKNKTLTDIIHQLHHSFKIYLSYFLLISYLFTLYKFINFY